MLIQRGTICARDFLLCFGAAAQPNRDRWPQRGRIDTQQADGRQRQANRHLIVTGAHQTDFNTAQGLLIDECL